jgi:hypothetical protein
MTAARGLPSIATRWSLSGQHSAAFAGRIGRHQHPERQDHNEKAPVSDGAHRGACRRGWSRGVGATQYAAYRNNPVQRSSGYMPNHRLFSQRRELSRAIERL